MQLKYILPLVFFISSQSFGYDCKTQVFKGKLAAEKKEAYQAFAKLPRQTLVEAMLFEVTTAKKMDVKKAQWLLDYLENTEMNNDQQSFFKLISYSSEIEAVRPKKLKLTEVCDIMKKVNDLPK
jgi:hypothetical protein